MDLESIQVVMEQVEAMVSGWLKAGELQLRDPEGRKRMGNNPHCRKKPDFEGPE